LAYDDRHPGERRGRGRHDARLLAGVASVGARSPRVDLVTTERGPSSRTQCSKRRRADEAGRGFSRKFYERARAAPGVLARAEGRGGEVVHGGRVLYFAPSRYGDSSRAARTTLRVPTSVIVRGRKRVCRRRRGGGRTEASVVVCRTSSEFSIYVDAERGGEPRGCTFHATDVPVRPRLTDPRFVLQLPHADPRRKENGALRFGGVAGRSTSRKTCTRTSRPSRERDPYPWTSRRATDHRVKPRPAYGNCDPRRRRGEGPVFAAWLKPP